MNCNNVLLIASSYIRLKFDDQIYHLDLPKNILKHGVVINYDQFLHKYLQLFNRNKLSKAFWKRKIKIIYNVLNTENDVTNLYNLFRDLNYREINLVNEKHEIKISQKDNYLIVDQTLRLFYIDKYNVKKVMILDKELYYPHEIRLLVTNRSLNKNLIVVGNCPKEILSSKINYYLIDDLNEFFLKI